MPARSFLIPPYLTWTAGIIVFVVIAPCCTSSRIPLTPPRLSSFPPDRKRQRAQLLDELLFRSAESRVCIENNYTFERRDTSATDCTIFYSDIRFTNREIISYPRVISIVANSEWLKTCDSERERSHGLPGKVPFRRLIVSLYRMVNNSKTSPVFSYLEVYSTRTIYSPSSLFAVPASASRVCLAAELSEISRKLGWLAGKIAETRSAISRLGREP